MFRNWNVNLVTEEDKLTLFAVARKQNSFNNVCNIWQSTSIVA